MQTAVNAVVYCANAFPTTAKQCIENRKKQRLRHSTVSQTVHKFPSSFACNYFCTAATSNIGQKHKKTLSMTGSKRLKYIYV